MAPENCTQSKINEKSLELMTSQVQALFRLIETQTHASNSILLTLERIENDSKWYKNKIENHIKNSVKNIEQIATNKDNIEERLKESEKIEIKANNNTKMLWFLFTLVVGGAFFIIRDYFLKGGAS